MNDDPGADFEGKLKAVLQDARILLLEDDDDYAKPIIQHLKDYGAQVEHFTVGEDARDAAGKAAYDALLLDRQNPGMDGLDVMREIQRGSGPSSSAPVLIVTSMGALGERRSGMLQGADDYIVKPVDEFELVARVAARIRRQGDQKKPAAILENGPLRIDSAARTALGFGQPLGLKDKELLVLIQLAQEVGEPISKSMLFDRCWPDYSLCLEGWENRVFQSINRLKDQLEAFESRLPPSLRPIIGNVRGSGYFLRDLSGWQQSPR